MSSDKVIHKHAFWLYGVLLGLAIKQAIETTIPHLISPERLPAQIARAGGIIHFPHPDTGFRDTGIYLEILRVTIVMALVIRFYLGSAYYYGKAYEASDADEKYPKKNYGVDFVFGFIHFLAFLILALTIDIHTAQIRWFPSVVGFILIYDFFWYASSFKQDTSELLVWWMMINGINALFSTVLYLIVERATDSVIKAEMWALIPVLIVSAFDIGWMMLDKPFFDPIKNTLTRRRRNDEVS